MSPISHEALALEWRGAPASMLVVFVQFSRESQDSPQLVADRLAYMMTGDSGLSCYCHCLSLQTFSLAVISVLVVTSSARSRRGVICAVIAPDKGVS